MIDDLLDYIEQSEYTRGVPGPTVIPEKSSEHTNCSDYGITHDAVHRTGRYSICQFYTNDAMDVTGYESEPSEEA